VLIMTAIVICALLATCICLLVRAMRHLKQAEEKLKSAIERADKWEAQCFNLGRRLREAEDDCGHLAVALAEEQGHGLSMSANAQANKNETVLNDFVAYCEQHPGERFWQALRNWSGQPFILACDDIEGGRTIDTFYWEGKEGRDATRMDAIAQADDPVDLNDKELIVEMSRSPKPSHELIQPLPAIRSEV
jgi:hypothetical protein